MSKLLSAGRPSETKKSQSLKELSKEKTVRVNFDLPEDLHTQLKLYAVGSRRSISDILREMIEIKLS